MRSLHSRQTYDKTQQKNEKVLCLTMWFKNILFYRFTKPFEMSSDELSSALSSENFKPCGPHDLAQLGWSPVLGQESSEFVHVTDKYWMICLQKQERILPSSVVNEQVALRAAEIEEQQHRKVSRKEKSELKDQITTELLPRSFTRTVRHFAYLCPKDGYLVVNTSSAKLADEFTAHLRKTIGSLPVRLPEVNNAPSTLMGSWVTMDAPVPSGFEVGFECELVSNGEDKGSIKYKGLELDTDQVKQNIESGMEVTRLELTWRESISFVLGSDLSLKRLKFADVLQEKFDDIEAEDAAGQFDAGFAIMAMEFDRLIPELLECFGGEDTSAIVEA